MDFKAKLDTVSAYKKARKYLMNKYPYFTIEEYMERMDTAFGRENYIVTYESVPHVIFPNGQVILQCKCHVDIYHEGKVALSVDGMGSKEVPTNDSGSYINLNTIALSAQQNAFKSACKELKIFGAGNVDKEGSAGGDNGRSANGNGGNNSSKSGSKSEKETKTLSFYVKELPEEVRKDERSGKAVYRMKAYVVNDDGKTCHTKPCEVIFYPNTYSKNAGRMNQLLSMGDNGMKTRLNVTVVSSKPSNDDFEGSYVLKAFA